MADDTVPMPIIFPACRKVAEEMMMPLHYTKLTLLALERLHISDSTLNLKRQIEDVREKLLEKGGHGFGYIGSPFCLAYLKEWLPQTIMFNPYSPIVIMPSLDATERAIVEIAMRPYKDKTLAPKEIIARVRGPGLLIQEHVRCWFVSRWPEMVSPPDNEGLWESYCYHDFKLKIDGNIRLVDVAGKKKNGFFGGGKQVTDIHILASRGKGVFLMHGFVYGSEFKDNLSEWESRPIAQMVFYLHCKQLGIDYGLFSQKGGQ